MNVTHLPIPTAISRPYWDALNRHEVHIQHCTGCGAWVHYPRSHCPTCLSPALEWKKVSGQGVLYAFTISRVPTLAEFRDAVPQFLAVVELDEGVRINSVVIGVEPEALKIGMRMKPAFAANASGQTLLHFAPA